MESKDIRTRIGILGGGPSGLFVFKRLVESGREDLEISLFEKKNQLGAGMPYSYDGACHEHITNVSGNEIPDIVNSMKNWIRTASPEVLKPFNMVAEKFNVSVRELRNQSKNFLRKMFVHEYAFLKSENHQKRRMRPSVLSNLLIFK